MTMTPWNPGSVVHNVLDGRTHAFRFEKSALLGFSDHAIFSQYRPMIGVRSIGASLQRVVNLASIDYKSETL